MKLREVVLACGFAAGCVVHTDRSPSQPQPPPPPGTSTEAPVEVGPSGPGAPTTTPAPVPASGEIQMPDVAGLTETEARAKLTAAGKVGEITINPIGMGGDDCKQLGRGKARSSSPGAGNLVNRKTPATIDLCGP